MFELTRILKPEVKFGPEHNLLCTKLKTHKKKTLADKMDPMPCQVTFYSEYARFFMFMVDKKIDLKAEIVLFLLPVLYQTGYPPPTYKYKYFWFYFGTAAIQRWIKVQP